MDRFQLQRAPKLSAQQIEESLSLQESFGIFELVQQKRQLKNECVDTAKNKCQIKVLSQNSQKMEQTIEMGRKIYRKLKAFQHSQDHEALENLKQRPFVRHVEEIIGLEEQQSDFERHEANLNKLLKANPYLRKVKTIEQVRLITQDNLNQSNKEQIQLPKIEESINTNQIEDSIDINNSDLDGDLDFDSVSDNSSDEDSESIIIIKPQARSQVVFNNQEPLFQQIVNISDSPCQQEINDYKKDQQLIAESKNEMEIDQLNPDVFNSKSSGYRKKTKTLNVDEYDFDSLNSMPTLDHL